MNNHHYNSDIKMIWIFVTILNNKRDLEELLAYQDKNCNKILMLLCKENKKDNFNLVADTSLRVPHSHLTEAPFFLWHKPEQLVCTPHRQVCKPSIFSLWLLNREFCNVSCFYWSRLSSASSSYQCSLHLYLVDCNSCIYNIIVHFMSNVPALNFMYAYVYSLFLILYTTLL